GADRLLDPDSMQPQLRAELAKLRVNEPGSRARLAYVRWSGCGNRYPLVLGGNPATVTPAFAAFEAYCESHPTRPQCSASPPGTHAEDFLHAMIVRSGAFPPASQAFAYGSDACQPFANAQGEVPLWRRSWVTLQQLMLGLFGDLREAR